LQSGIVLKLISSSRQRNAIPRRATNKESKMKVMYKKIAGRALLGALLCTAVACGSDMNNNNPMGPTPPTTASVKVMSSATLGNYLADGSGRSLYYFAFDLPAGTRGQPAVSNCTGQCVGYWPIFHADLTMSPQGVDASDLAEITRSDGTKQTTYKGWPLYYYVSDSNAGDTKGEGVNGVWFVAHQPWYTIALLSKQSGPTYLTDSDGRALYYFFNDQVGTSTTPPVSNCTSDQCMSNWPIFLTESAVVPSTLDKTLFTVFTRADGQRQSAYKGHPLYYFTGDANPGDTNGRHLFNLWEIIDPSQL